MDNTIVYLGFIYLILFRISVIILGGMSIYLGYRLFMRGLGNAQESNNQETEVSAKIGTSNFTLKNAAPGTFFVLFGSAMVISMMTSQQPEIYLRKESPAKDKEQTIKDVSKNKEEPKISEFRMRDLSSSQEKSDFVPIKNVEADKTNQEIWEQVKKDLKRLEHANQLENHPELLDSLASFYFISKDYNKAVETQQKAVNLAKENIEFRRKLIAYQQLQAAP